MDRSILIFCSAPGLIRAGICHPQVAAHPFGRFTDLQLHELLADPDIVVAVGTQVTQHDWTAWSVAHGKVLPSAAVEQAKFAAALHADAENDAHHEPDPGEAAQSGAASQDLAEAAHPKPLRKPKR